MMGRRGRRCKQLLGDLKEKSGCCKLKDEALDRTVWRTGFGRDCGTVVRQTLKRMDSNMKLTLEAETPRHAKQHS